MVRLATLQEKRLALHARMKAHADKPVWTQGDQETFERMEAEYRGIMNEIAREGGVRTVSALGEDDDRLPGGGRVAGGSALADASDVDLALAGWVRNAYGEPVPLAEARACERLGYAVNGSGFMVNLAPARPTNGRNLRFDIAGVRNAQSKGTNSAGGYTVPTGFVPRLEVALKQFAPMLQVAEVTISEDGRTAPWPLVDDTANEGSQIAENTAVSDLDLTFSSKTFTPYKFTSGMIKASHELLRDNAVGLSGAIADAMGVRLGRVVNRLCTTGSGSSTIEGVVTGATLGKTAAAATAITMDEIIDLMHSVDPAYRVGPSVGFMMNDATAGYAQKLKDGQGRYLWTESVREGEPARLLGHPVYINQSMADIATGAKTVLFGDFSKYKVRIVGGLRLRTLSERYAEYDQTGFVGFMEVDAKLLDAGTHPVKYLVQA